ncbi:MAG: hypothetical protein MK110_07815 [Fuerstiella sp.]|nr:hypothetical protein [Fuerstiella sp.]
MLATSSNLVVTDRRGSNNDRRIRKIHRPEDIASENSGQEQIIDRRKQERRRQIDPTTCERDYSLNEVEFMRAMDEYKRKSGRPFPTWSEVLEVLMSLGYRKVAEPTEMHWRSSAD